MYSFKFNVTLNDSVIVNCDYVSWNVLYKLFLWSSGPHQVYISFFVLSHPLSFSITLSMTAFCLLCIRCTCECVCLSVCLILFDPFSHFHLDYQRKYKCGLEVVMWFLIQIPFSIAIRITGIAQLEFPWAIWLNGTDDILNNSRRKTETSNYVWVCNSTFTLKLSIKYRCLMESTEMISHSEWEGELSLLFSINSIGAMMNNWIGHHSGITHQSNPVSVCFVCLWQLFVPLRYVMDYFVYIIF